LVSNAHAQRPECEQREHPDRWSVMLGSCCSFDDAIRTQQQGPRDR
jgi:hypothetical protein